MKCGNNFAETFNNRRGKLCAFLVRYRTKTEPGQNSQRQVIDDDFLVTLQGLLISSAKIFRKPGDIVRAQIHDCNENDLFGDVIHED